MDIPDALLIEAKKLAVEQRRPLRELIIEGLEGQLREAKAPETPRAKRKIRWVVHRGGVPAGLNLSDRAAMNDFLRSER